MYTNQTKTEWWQNMTGKIINICFELVTWYRYSSTINQNGHSGSNSAMEVRSQQWFVDVRSEFQRFLATVE